MLSTFTYGYQAKVTCTDGTVRDVSGKATFESAQVKPDVLYLLKCQILHDKFKPNEAVGTNSVELVTNMCLSGM